MLPLNLYARVRILDLPLHARPRVQRASGFPCALCFQREKVLAQLGRYQRREIARVSFSSLKIESEV
jgi:hypothetical protein